MFTMVSSDQVSAVVRDGKLYEADGVTVLNNVVFVNGVLMREVPIEQAHQFMADHT